VSEESLGFRLVFSHAQVSTGRFRQGFAEAGDFTAINAAAAALGKANIYLDGEADQSMDMIAAKARRMARQYGIKLFVLDYLQLLDSDDDSDRLRVLRRISKKLVSLKKRLQIPWLVLAQMNRNIETAERARKPVLSDLKESGSIEQDADKVIFLYHPLKAEGIEADEEAIEGILKGLYGDKIKAEDRPRRINAVVAKNRNGPTGTAQLLFQNNQCLFHDWRRWELAKGLVQKAAGERPPEQTTLIDPEDVP
jgi:replicative DNA helicase